MPSSNGLHDRVNDQRGSKLAGHARAMVPPGGTFTLRSAFAQNPRPIRSPISTPFLLAAPPRRMLSMRPRVPQDSAPTSRGLCDRPLRGCCGRNSIYHYDVYRWLMGDPTRPPPPEQRWHGRNTRWKELHNADVILMPDTWEYPWYASWDLAFQCVAMARIDPALAKQQLLRMGYEWYQHANGQFPAYEWNFDDVNPPVTGWAAWRVYQIDLRTDGHRRSRSS